MPNYSKKFKVTTIAPKLGFKNIPWHEAREVYLAAAEKAGMTADAAHEEANSAKLASAQEQVYQHPEEGAYEGNISDNVVTYDIDPDYLANLKDRAGQNAIAEEFVKRYGLIEFPQSFMPEIITLLAGMQLKRNANGLISGLRFRNENFTTPAMKGLYRFLMLDARSTYLKQQYKGANSNYCALVPLIMYAHKLVHRVPYMEWDPSEIQFVVNDQLAEAMLCKPQPLTQVQLLHERQEGLRIRSGDKEGTFNSSVWKHRLAGPQLKTGPLKDVPYLAQVMLTQIWCAHPDNRSGYMVLSPNNWDKVPPALVAKDILMPAVSKYIFTQVPDDSGWSV